MGVSSERVGHAGPGQEGAEGFRPTAREPSEQGLDPRNGVGGGMQVPVGEPTEPPELSVVHGERKDDV
ncbi:MAG: hypothetical protein JWQ32_3601 [Marmoricola sp.]|nr:hypothetical protein [Marmoricola sp.]